MLKPFSWSIVLLPLLITSCRYFSRSPIAGCSQVVDVTMMAESIPSYKGRSAAVYRANQLELAADNLEKITIEDKELDLYRDSLNLLYRQSSDLIMQETAFMEDNGTVSVADSGHSAYQQVLVQHADLSLQVQQQHNFIHAYCGYKA